MIYVLSYLFSGIVSVVVLRLIASNLDPGSYGLYSTALATASVLSALAFQWIRIPYLRRLYRLEKADSPWTLDINAVFLVAVAFPIVGALWLLFPIRSLESSPVAVLALGFTLGAYELSLARARGLGERLQYAVMSFGRALLWLSFVILMSNYGASAQDYLIRMMYVLLVVVMLYVLHIISRVECNHRKLEIKLSALANGRSIVLLVLSTGTGLAHLPLIKNYLNSLGGNDSYSAILLIDVLYLIMLTPMLLINIALQKRAFALSEKASRTLLGDRVRMFAAAAAVGWVVVCSMILWNNTNELIEIASGRSGVFSLSELEARLFIFGVGLLGLKQYWLDQAFYYREDYFALALTNGMILVLFVAATALTVDAYGHGGLAYAVGFILSISIVMIAGSFFSSSIIYHGLISRILVSGSVLAVVGVSYAIF